MTIELPITGKKKTNLEIALHLLQKLIQSGVNEFCLCPGARNSPFIAALANSSLKQYFWFEERSAAFFALGKAKSTGRPVAVITTSGTAAGELLPAAMEAYYNGIPLVLVTADRPRCFRGTGAPQAAEQVGIFGVYAPFALDLAENEECDLQGWDRRAPLHLNICLEEPKDQLCDSSALLDLKESHPFFQPPCVNSDFLDHFLCSSRYPFAVVSSLKKESKEAVAQFLLRLNAPVYLEAVSGLREDPRLEHIRIRETDRIWSRAAKSDYPIDGILRIGGVPTFRLWRDLETRQGSIQVCSISEVPFSGLSWAEVFCTSLRDFFSSYELKRHYETSLSSQWIQQDRNYYKALEQLLVEEPESEPALVYELSKKIPKRSEVYLGNSLPIREWDAFASSENRHFSVDASRGLNGIDGQFSTFLGICGPEQSNWALLGDLTTLYDLAAPWILPQLKNCEINLVILNNGGGKIFDRMFSLKSIQNPHRLSFSALADFWGMSYEKWHRIPDHSSFDFPLHRGNELHRIIEIVPDEGATQRFWNKIAKL
jgi:2-succinyl-5-enolpyruvyl-6-hydroxy-3-cyclohexene-1-carboxylate synthase